MNAMNKANTKIAMKLKIKASSDKFSKLNSKPIIKDPPK